MLLQKRQHSLNKLTRTILSQIMRSVLDDTLPQHFFLRHLKRHLTRFFQVATELSA